MPTSIQIHKDVKEKLTGLKSKGESYEAVIKDLLTQIRNQRKLKNELIEGHREMAKDSVKICREWNNPDKWKI